MRRRWMSAHSRHVIYQTTEDTQSTGLLVTTVDSGSTNIALDLTLQNLRNLKVGCVQHVLVDSVFHLYLLAYMYIFYEPSYNLHFYLV